jgi:hypothetical protein
MFKPFVAKLWNQPVYAALIDDVDPYSQLSLFRERGTAFGGNNRFWATPSPEPQLPTSLIQKLAQPLAVNDPIRNVAANLASAIAAQYAPEKIIFVAILRAGVPVADWLTRLLPGSLAVATSLFVGLGIDTVSLQAIQHDFPERTIVFVDGWTGKGAVANELRKIDAGPLAVLCDPWRSAEFRGTTEDYISPSAFFTGPVTLGFSRTFTRCSTEPFAAYRFPEQLLVQAVAEQWQQSCPAVPQRGVVAIEQPIQPRFHATPLRLHSNEVCRALINSNPDEIMFCDSARHANDRYGLLIEFAELQKIKVRFDVSALMQFDAQVACSLKVSS